MNTDKLHYLFSPDELDLKYPSSEYLNFVSPHSISNKVFITADCHFCLSDKIVWDVFSGIGTDAIRLASFAGKVICSEINPTTFECLKTNIELKQLQNKVTPFLRNGCHEWLSCDVIYFDPPWGKDFGTDNFDFLNIQFGSVTIKHLLQKLYEKHYLIIKVPICAQQLDYLFEDQDIVQILSFKTQKLVYYIIKPKHKK